MELLLGAPKLYSSKCPEVDFSEVRAAPIQLRGASAAKERSLGGLLCFRPVLKTRR